MRIPLLAGGELGWESAPTRAGDHVVMRAELDLYLVVSACPQDIMPINAGAPTPVAIELLGG